MFPYSSNLKTLLLSDGYLNINSKYVLIEKTFYGTFFNNFFNVYFERERVHTCKCGEGQGVGEGERIPIRLHTVSAELHAGHLTNLEIMI